MPQLPRGPQKKMALRRTGKETPGQVQGLVGKFVRLDGERLIVYIGLPWYRSIQSDEVPMTGRYRLKVVAQAVNTGDRPLPLNVTVLSSIHERDTAGRTLATFDVPPDRPGVFELETVLEKLNGIRINGWQLPDENTVRDRLKGQPLETYTGPGFAFELMELERPSANFRRRATSGCSEICRSNRLPCIRPNSPAKTARDSREPQRRRLAARSADSRLDRPACRRPAIAP